MFSISVHGRYYDTQTLIPEHYLRLIILLSFISSDCEGLHERHTGTNTNTALPIFDTSVQTIKNSTVENYISLSGFLAHYPHNYYLNLTESFLD